MPDESKNPQQETKNSAPTSPEAEIKQAFGEGKLEVTRNLIQKMKETDPGNSFADKILKKVEKAEEKAQQKQKADKLKEYEEMFHMLYQSAEVEKIYQLAKELKAMDPGSKTAEKWLKKAQKFETAVKRREHGGDIAKLRGKIKIAFAEKQYNDVISAVNELDAFEPGGSFGQRYLKKVEREKNRPEGEAPMGKMGEFMEEAKSFLEGMKGKWSKKTSPGSPAAPEGQTSATSSDEKNIFAGVIEHSGKNNEEQNHGPEGGNIFTQMFVSPEEKEGKKNKSIIDVIVDKTSKEKKKEKEQDVIHKKKVKTQGKVQEGVVFLKVAKSFMNFTIVFIVLGGAFLYVNIVDTNNMVLQIFNINSNYASQLHGAAEKIESLKKKKGSLEEDINLYEAGYDDQYEETINNIIDKRLNWPDVLAKINEVSNSMYELNDFFQYIEFNNFSFNAEDGRISLTGSLRDPGDRNLTRMVELEEAFKYYPGDKNISSDNIKPYFTNTTEFNSYSKSFDRNTGDYISRFSFSMKLNE